MGHGRHREHLPTEHLPALAQDPRARRGLDMGDPAESLLDPRKLCRIRVPVDECQRHQPLALVGTSLPRTLGGLERWLHRLPDVLRLRPDPGVAIRTEPGRPDQVRTAAPVSSVVPTPRVPELRVDGSPQLPCASGETRHVIALPQDTRCALRTIQPEPGRRRSENGALHIDREVVVLGSITLQSGLGIPALDQEVGGPLDRGVDALQVGEVVGRRELLPQAPHGKSRLVELPRDRPAVHTVRVVVHGPVAGWDPERPGRLRGLRGLRSHVEQVVSEGEPREAGPVQCEVDE